MNEITTMTSLIEIVDGVPTTTSQKVADHFSKLHKNVLRDIENLRAQVPPEWHQLNFEPMFADVQIGQGATRKDPAFLVTRDGFTMLAMGFTGAAAIKFKLDYISEFNRMEKVCTRDGLHQQIANAEARVRAEMLANQPVNLLDWLHPTSVMYFGLPGTTHPERKYHAVLEAREIGYPAIARKYGIPMATMKKWAEETTKAELHTIGHMLCRTNPLDAIQYDLDVEKQARDAAKLKLEKTLQRLERKQLKLTQKTETLKLNA